jgi:hypothetical protein
VPALDCAEPVGSVAAAHTAQRSGLRIWLAEQTTKLDKETVSSNEVLTIQAQCRQFGPLNSVCF